MSEPTAREQYTALAAKFAKTHKLPKGGAQLDYLSAGQVVERLTDVLGADNWEFELREHGREADTLWTLGRLTVHFPTRTVVREQFGECQTNRGMAEGDARKGAASDALKKCASLVGVGLYLSEKDDPVVNAPARQAAPLQRAPARQAQAAPPTSAPPSDGGHETPTGALAGGGAPPEDRLLCEQCGAELEEIRFRDGTAWLPVQLAGLGRRKHGKVLCMTHYRHANEARIRQAPPPEGAASAPRFQRGANERAQQFLKACRDDLGLEMAAVQELLGGKVSAYLALCKLNGQPDVSYEDVYARLEAHVKADAPIPFVAAAPATAAVATLQDDLAPTPA